MAGTTFTSFDGTNIYYDVDKQSDSWVVFLHGFGGDSGAWEEERASLSAQGLSTVALDLRGHGLSGRGQDTDFYAVDAFVQDVILLLEHLKIKKICLVGHCFGGMIALTIAARYPKLIQALILIDTSYKPPFTSSLPLQTPLIESLFSMLGRFAPTSHISGHADFSSMKGTKDYDLKRIASDISHTSLKTYLLICENLVEFNAQDILENISVPTLIMEGEDDTIFPPSVAEYLTKRIKHSELDLIPQANHILVINNAGEVFESITRFLQKVSFHST